MRAVERAGRRLRVGLAAERGRLGLVRRQDGTEREQLVGQRARRGGVKHDLQIGGPRSARGRQHRRVRHLEPDQHHAAGLRARSAASTAAGVSSLLAPEATAIWFSPASSTAISATPVGAVTRATAETSTPSRLQVGDRLVAEVVAADRADHPHRRALPRRRHRLVRALAAAVALEGAAGHRLARAGQRRRPHDEVEVDRAHHVHVACHRLG